MALFFNLAVLEEQAENNTHKFLTMLEFHFTKKIPKSRFSKDVPSKVSLAGHSYLLEPAKFFADKSTDPLYKLQYIQLAARRDYNLYKQYGYKALQTSYFPDLNLAAISSNPLLTITKSEVSFKYE
jgi:hypothetical protein